MNKDTTYQFVKITKEITDKLIDMKFYDVIWHNGINGQTQGNYIKDYSSQVTHILLPVEEKQVSKEEIKEYFEIFTGGNQMKTAAKIIDEKTFVKDGLITVELAMECMSDFAMQNAIEFDTWKYKNCWVMWEDGLYHNLPKGLANFEPVRVYNLFKQRNNG